VREAVYRTAKALVHRDAPAAGDEELINRAAGLVTDDHGVPAGRRQPRRELVGKQVDFGLPG
jgi:hypothetical protein